MRAWNESHNVVWMVLVCLFIAPTAWSAAGYNYTVVGNASTWVGHLTGMRGDVNGTLIPSIARLVGATAQQQTLPDAWTAGGSKGAVFLHPAYVVAYLESVSTIGGSGLAAAGDRAAVIIYPTCPSQYEPPLRFVASPTRPPPLCIQPTTLLVVRPYLLEWVRAHLLRLMANGTQLFEFSGDLV